ncbi:MAG: DoxX family protein [Planctomycetota bacterium]
MKTQQSMLDAGLLGMRITVGLYMLLAGFGKVRGEISNGLGSFYRGPFKSMQPTWLPDAMALPYGYVLPWIEVLVGIMLILGLFTRLVGLAGLGMLVSFTIALIIKLDTIKAQPDGPGGPFSANYIQSSAYLLFVLVGAGNWSIDSLRLKRKKSG